MLELVPSGFATLRTAVTLDSRHCDDCHAAVAALSNLGSPGASSSRDEAARVLQEWYMDQTPVYPTHTDTQDVTSLLEIGHRRRLPGWSHIWVRRAFHVVRRPAEQIELLHSAMFLNCDSVLSRRLLRLVGSIGSPVERGHQLGRALFVLTPRDARKALDMIAALSSEPARYHAVRAGYFGLGQAHPELAQRLVDIAGQIDDPSLRAKALLACLPADPSSPEELALAEQVLTAASLCPDSVLRLFCHLRLHGDTEEVLADLRDAPDFFQLEAWKYLIASERNGISPMALEYSREYCSIGARLSGRKAVESGLTLLMHLAGYCVPPVVQDEILAHIAARMNGIQDCAARREAIMLVIGVLNE